MKKNQNGFSVLLIIVILATVGVAVIAGWYVWRSQGGNEKSSDNEQSSSSNLDSSSFNENQDTKEENISPSLETENWESHTRYGITFKSPGEWGFVSNNGSQSTSTIITSPDFIDDGITGEQITIDEAIFEKPGLTADSFKASHLDVSSNPYSDFRILNVNGNKAVQFFSGDSRTTVFFLSGGKTTSFTLDNFSDRTANSTVYEGVISTVVVN